jgi:hypothetical protein
VRLSTRVNAPSYKFRATSQQRALAPGGRENANHDGCHCFSGVILREAADLILSLLLLLGMRVGQPPKINPKIIVTSCRFPHTSFDVSIERANML